MTSALFGERYPSKVGAAFSNNEQAHRAMDRLTTEGIDASHIRVVEPNDPSVDRKLEPEPRGIAKTIVRSHLTLGAAGLLVGFVAAFALEQTRIDIFMWNSLYTYGTFGFVGAMLGMLLAGFLSLRPDQDPLIAWVKEGIRRGRWYLLVHARDANEKERARHVLQAMSSDVVSTL